MSDVSTGNASKGDVSSKVFVVKDAGLWKDVPEDNLHTDIAFSYGIVPEGSTAYNSGIRAVIKFLAVGTSESVHERAEKLAGQNNNRHIMEGPIGGWLPLSINYEQYTKEIKIQQKEGQQSLRAYTSEEDKLAKREMKEIDDRREALKEEEVSLEDTTTLEYYTMQRNKESEIERFIMEGEKKMDEARKKHRDVKLRNIDLREANPHYEDLWKEELKRKRNAEGAGGERPPIINERVE